VNDLHSETGMQVASLIWHVN